MIYLLGSVVVVALAAWDAWRRYLKASESCNQACIKALQEELQQVEKLAFDIRSAHENLDVTLAKHQAAMTTFLGSILDIVKISEDEKTHLLNRAAAAKMGKLK